LLTNKNILTVLFYVKNYKKDLKITIILGISKTFLIFNFEAHLN